MGLLAAVVAWVLGLSYSRLNIFFAVFALVFVGKMVPCIPAIWLLNQQRKREEEERQAARALREKVKHLECEADELHAVLQDQVRPVLQARNFDHNQLQWAFRRLGEWLDHERAIRHDGPEFEMVRAAGTSGTYLVVTSAREELEGKDCMVLRFYPSYSIDRGAELGNLISAIYVIVTDDIPSTLAKVRQVGVNLKRQQ